MEVGDLVVMKLGFSGPGLITHIHKQHPRAEEARFSQIYNRLNRPYASVMWSDAEAVELCALDELRKISNQ